MTGRLAAALLVVLAGQAPAPRLAEDPAALFERLDGHMSVAGLHVEGATLETALRLLGAPERRGGERASRSPSPCWVAPDGTRLDLGFDTGEGTALLRRFDLGLAADPGACRRVKALPRATDGGLRLGMRRAEVEALLGRGTGGASGDGSRYVASATRELSPAQREILSEAGVDPGDLVVERELRLEFRADRLVAIHARQSTRG